MKIPKTENRWTSQIDYAILIGRCNNILYGGGKNIPGNARIEKRCLSSLKNTKIYDHSAIRKYLKTYLELKDEYIVMGVNLTDIDRRKE